MVPRVSMGQNVVFKRASNGLKKRTKVANMGQKGLKMAPTGPPNGSKGDKFSAILQTCETGGPPWR